MSDSKEQSIMSYIRHYPEWWNIVRTTADIRQGIRYDLDKIQTSPDGDIVFNLAWQISECEDKILKVERCLWDVGRVNTKVSLLRDVYCYGERKKMRKGQYYKWYHKLAKRLLMEEWNLNENSRNPQDQSY